MKIFTLFYLSLFFVLSAEARVRVEGVFEIYYAKTNVEPIRIFDRVSLDKAGIAISSFMREGGASNDPTNPGGKFCWGMYEYDWHSKTLSVNYAGVLEWGKLCPQFSFIASFGETNIYLMNVGDVVSGHVKSMRSFNNVRNIIFKRVK